MLYVNTIGKPESGEKTILLANPRFLVAGRQGVYVNIMLMNSTKEAGYRPTFRAFMNDVLEMGVTRTGAVSTEDLFFQN